jgi:hypothetical protein
MTPQHQIGLAEAHTFKNIGWLSARLSDAALEPIWKEVRQIMSDFDAKEGYNKELAGNITREYQLKDCHDHVAQTVLPYILAYEQHFELLKETPFLTNYPPESKIEMETTWVNFQKKHEFNPPHIHGGTYSFVIWLQVPYDIKDELALSHSASSKDPLSGHFSFQYTNTVGRVRPQILPVDKTWQGVIAVFPAEMLHAVYPFYTSDDYRITVSGNYSVVHPDQNK